jgi:hypothetical protein
MIKVTHRDDTTTVNYKRSDGSGGYEPGKLIVDETRTLSNGEWNDILKLLEGAKFWELNTNDNTFIVFDGTNYIVDVSMEGKYHVVNRNRGYHIGEICLYLFDLANIDLIQENLDETRKLATKWFAENPTHASNPARDSLVEAAVKVLTKDTMEVYELMLPELFQRELKWKEQRYLEELFEDN